MDSFLSIFRRKNSLSKQDRFMHILHETNTSTNRQTLEVMSDCPVRRRQFFDIEKEYANVVCDSDVSISDLASDTSFSVTEGGYISDVSERDYTLHNSNEKNGNRKRRTKQHLDSCHQSKFEFISDTEDNTPVSRKFVRKQKVKEPKSTNNNHDYKNSVDGKLLYAMDDEQQKRRSWTDSGVSLSRTDQSRCGTIKTDTSCSCSDNKDVTLDILLPDDDSANSSLKETDADATTQEFMDGQISPSFMKGCFIQEEMNMNRLSLITDKSSLTNVTILSTNPSSPRSSLSSLLSECTSVNYVTSATETKCLDTDSESDSYQESCIEKLPDTDCSDASLYSNEKKENEIVSQLVKNARTESVNQDSPKSAHFEGRRRGSSLLHGLKKVKEHLKPRFLNSKQYKDVSSEFSFEKTETDKHREAFEELTSHVFGKLSKLETNDAEFKRLSATMDNVCFEKLQNASKTPNTNKIQNTSLPTTNGKEILEKLSTRPTKHNTFLKKLFRRSRSFSAERIVKKSKVKDVFKRSSNQRSSARSIPDHFGASSKFPDNRFAKSFENLQHGTSQSTDDINLLKNRSQTFNGRIGVTNYDPISDHLPRASSLTSLNDIDTPAISKPRASSTPNTPAMMRNVPPSNQYAMYGLNSYENECDCDECIYADYMDYLAFQHYRKYGYQHQPAFSPIAFQTPFHTSYANTEQHTYDIIDGTPENVIAPLSVQVDEERQAKTLKTSMYDTFV